MHRQSKGKEGLKDHVVVSDFLEYQEKRKVSDLQDFV